MGHGARGLLRVGELLGLLLRTITPAAAPTAGARTACWASPTASAASASRLALWNGRDPILKERLFGLTGPEGNHGEDVKECYYYLDSHADALLHEGALQVPAGRVSRTRGWSRRTAAAASTTRSSSCSTRASSTRTATSTSSPSTRRRRPTTSSIRITVANRGPEAADAPPAADALVPQHLVVGLHAARAAGRKPRDRSATAKRCVAEHATLGRFDSSQADAGTPGSRDARSSPRTRRTRAALRRAERAPVREGRVPRVRRSAAHATR